MRPLYKWARRKDGGKRLVVLVGSRLLISVMSAERLRAVRLSPYFVLIERALRDEGTSYHYLPPACFSEADAESPPSERMTTISAIENLVGVSDQRHDTDARPICHLFGTLGPMADPVKNCAHPHLKARDQTSGFPDKPDDWIGGKYRSRLDVENCVGVSVKADWRLIPARAGNTARSGRRRPHHSPAHPRARP